jgi:hypothetical protein
MFSNKLVFSKVFMLVLLIGILSITFLATSPSQAATALVNANEVVWIGDSWIQIPGIQHTRVRDLARAAGVIGANEDFVDLAVSGSTLETICQQYYTREAGSVKVKVLLMDGGGINMFPSGGSLAQAQANTNTFKQFLQRVKSDGTVQHVIYYIYPLDQVCPGVTQWKPLMQQAAAESPVPCHFIDLAPLFAGHPEYIGSDGIHPSDAGARPIADAVWACMQQYNVLQVTNSATPTPTLTPVRTATPRPTATPVRTATPRNETPVPTATPILTTPPVATPTPIPTTGSIKVQFYNQSTAAISNQIYLNMKLVNTGSNAVALSNVKIRYYYTINGAQTQNFYCDWSPIGSSNVTGSFVTMSTPKTGADIYVEVGFTSGAGSLAAGGNTTVQARVAKSNWTNYTQTDDYSFNSSATTFVDWTKVTGYVSGALQWGTEP